MIAQKAYEGNKLVYRAYKGGRIIWDLGVYTFGSVIATLNALARPQAEDPESIRMDAVGTTDVMGLAKAMEFDRFISYAYGTQTGNTIPRARETVHGAGTAEGLIQAVGAPATFGMVFSRGLAIGDITGIAMPHAVETVYGRGTAEAAGSGYAMPYVETMLRLIAEASGESQGWMVPQLQDPERVLMGASSESVASGCPTTLPVCHVTFMHNGREIHRETVIQGYDCPDPVVTGVMDAPTKAPTVSHTYEHSGWSRTEGGAAETGEAEAIFEEQTLDGFTLMEAYNLHGYPSGVLIELVEGETYQVTWDGKPYFCKAIDVSAVISGGIAIGDGSAYGYPGNGEPFMILATPGYTQFFAFDDAASHTVSIIKGSGLNNIFCDTVVYAAFTESIRYYDISFYDEGKLLDTVPFAYGETPSYTAVKEGYICTGWTPEPVPVTGEARYIAQWKQLSAFADATWDEIAMVAESGNADKAYAIGDQKVIQIPYASGDVVADVAFEIVGFNHDDLADGTGKAGITLMSVAAPYQQYFCGASPGASGTAGGHNWDTSTIRNKLNTTTFNSLPDDVRAHIKEVSKLSAKGNTVAIVKTVDKIFLPSATEMVGEKSYTNYVIAGQGAQYARFTTAANRLKVSLGSDGVAGTSYTTYVLRGRAKNWNSTCSISNNGAAIQASGANAPIGFCI